MIRRMLSPVMMMITMMVVMVMATNSVNMERTGQQKMADGSSKARMVELDQTWPLSDEFKAILGREDCFHKAAVLSLLVKGFRSFALSNMHNSKLFTKKSKKCFYECEHSFCSKLFHEGANSRCISPPFPIMTTLTTHV